MLNYKIFTANGFIPKSKPIRYIDGEISSNLKKPMAVESLEINLTHNPELAKINSWKDFLNCTVDEKQSAFGNLYNMMFGLAVFEKNNPAYSQTTVIAIGYCRSHFFKSCLFRGNIQEYFKDYYGPEYASAYVTDMFGRSLKVSLVQNMHKWNEELLKLPIDKISDASDSLSKIVDGLNDVKSEHETVISAVTGAISDEIDRLNDEKEAYEDTINDQKEALQDRMDLLDNWQTFF